MTDTIKSPEEAAEEWIDNYRGGSLYSASYSNSSGAESIVYLITARKIDEHKAKGAVIKNLTEGALGLRDSYLAGDKNGYERGLRDTGVYQLAWDRAVAKERERIWDAVKRAQSTAEFHMLGKLAGGVSVYELQQIIFGDGK